MSTIFARIFNPFVNSSKLILPSTTTSASSASFSRQSANKSAKIVTSIRAVRSSIVTIPNESPALISNHTKTNHKTCDSDCVFGPFQIFQWREPPILSNHLHTNQLGVPLDTDPVFLSHHVRRRAQTSQRHCDDADRDQRNPRIRSLPNPNISSIPTAAFRAS